MASSFLTLLLSPLHFFASYLHQGEHFYYRSVWKLHHHRRLTLDSRRNAAENFSLLLLAFRMGNLVVWFRTPPSWGLHLATFAHLDPIQWYVLSHQDVYGVYFSVVFAVAPLYVWILRVLFAFVPVQNMCWSFFHDVAVRNVDAFAACRISNQDALERLFEENKRQVQAFFSAKWFLEPLSWMLPRTVLETLVRLKIQLTAADVDRVKVCSGRWRLVENPQMDFELRARLANLVWLFNQLAMYFLWITTLTAFIVAYYYIPQVIAAYDHPDTPIRTSWAWWLLVTSWTLVHCAALYHMFNLLVTTALVLTYCAMISATVNTLHMGRWNRQLRKHLEDGCSKRKQRRLFTTLSSSSPHSGSPHSEVMISLFLKRLFKEHVRLSVQVLRSNSDLFGKTVLASLVTNIPINIAMVARGFFRQLPTLDKCSNWFFIGCQVFMLAMALVPLAMQGKRLHYAADLPRLQMLLGGGVGAYSGGRDNDNDSGSDNGGGETENTENAETALVSGGSSRRSVLRAHHLLKIKVLHYYLRIHTHVCRYGITVGPRSSSTLTFESLSEIISIYAAYLLYVFGLILQNDLQP